MNTDNTSQQQATSNQRPPNNGNPHQKSFMKTILELFGYQYYISRAAFSYQGSEIAFVNDGLLGKIRVYVDGEQIINCFSGMGTIRSSTSFSHAGQQFEIKSNCTGWFKSTQRIRLFVDQQEVDRKYDLGIEGLSWPQKIHFVVGAMMMGMVIGSVLQFIL